MKMTTGEIVLGLLTVETVFFKWTCYIFFFWIMCQDWMVRMFSVIF